jgi:Cu(I)/Ag(I) efflux system membrane fusion protein
MIKIIIFLLTLTLLQADVLEVKQLFNKKIVSVKSVKDISTKTFYATIKLDESRIFDVSLRFSGFIESLDVSKHFQQVKKGERLFTIYSKVLAELKAELDLAKEMRQRGAVRSLQKKLSLLKVSSTINKDFTVSVQAPASGVVLEKNINQGSFVKRGQKLFQIADMSKMWVILEVYQQDLAFIQKGMDATIMIEGKEPRKGSVDFIYPFMDKRSKKVDVRVVVDNPKGDIYPNLFAKVQLHTSAKTLLTLPKSAVLTKGANHYVFKPVGESEFEPLMIEAKRLDATRYVVTKGLKEGDKVIDRALFMLDADALTNGLYENDDDEEW